MSVINHLDMSGKITSIEMQRDINNENKTCHNDEVPTKLQTEWNSETEVPIRMNVVLRECYVVLHRLSEEQLRQFCNTDYINDVNEDVKCKTEELVNRTVEAVSDPLKSNTKVAYNKNEHRIRNMRNVSSLDFEAFEQYKQERRGFIKRRNRVPVHFENSANFEDNSDNSPDMSQDEFRSPGSQGRGRRRNKKVRKYERDSEWSPFASKNLLPSRRNLRRQVRRPVIESDTSSDEDDILFQFFSMNDFNSDVAPTDVPSQLDVNDPIASSTSSMSKTTVEKSSVETNLPEKGSSVIESQNSSLNTSGNASSILNTNHTSDIVSDIIRKMDQCKKGTQKLKAPLPDTIQKIASQKDVKPPLQRRRKRLKLSGVKKGSFENNVDLAVSSIIREMVNTVCIEQRQLQLKSKQLLKKCKWCHSQFPTNRPNEMHCPVCRDLGKEKLYSNKNSTKLPKSQKSPKQIYGNNKMGKKVSNTMSRVMKILPKHERQRLMYTEKSSKLPNEKGYNHCKSFNTHKGIVESVIDDQKTKMEGNDTHLGKEYEKVNTEKKIINHGRKKETDKSFISTKESTLANANCEKIQNVSNKENKQGVKRCVNDTNKTVFSKKHKTTPSPSTAGSTCNTEENTECAEDPSRKRKVSLKKCKEGLFLMTFPEPDEELDTCAQTNVSPELGTLQNKISLENSNKFNGSRATQMSDKNLVSSNTKSFQAISKDEQYQTYFLPPVPTVVVANYSASHDKNGDYCLSGIFYQNEYTQPLTNNSINPNVSSLCASSNVSALSSSGISYPNSCISNLQNNSSMTITTIPLDGGRSLNQPFTNSSSSVLNSLTVTASNNKVTLLPVVSSVVSLSDKNLSKPSNLKETNPNHASNLHVSNNNFINSEQLEIKITHVSSEKSCEKSNSKAIKPGSVPYNNEREISINSLLSDNTRQFPESKDVSMENHAGFSKSNKTTSENVSLNTVKTVSVSKVSVPKDQSNESELSEHSGVASKKGEDSVGHLEPTKFSDDNAKKSETVKNGTSYMHIENNLKCTEPSLITKEQIKNNLHQKQLIKPGSNVENTAPVDSIKSAIDLLGAISILAILDLEKNPHVGLSARIQVAKSNLAKLLCEKKITPDINERIISHQHNLQVLDIAKRFLILHGSFAKVSDFLLKKQQMMQIKRELLTEDEEDENQSSCRFSQRSQSNSSSVNEGEFSRSSTMPSPASLKVESFSSCRLSEQALTVNHIEKMQSQIAAMNHNLPNYDASPVGSTVHHFPSDQIAALPPSVAAPTPVTPRNDCMGGESRETPSRGSGPRTPARPESATSQPEEQSLVQIKKELMEASSSPPSQCAYSQNTTLSQITSQMSAMSEMQSLNMTGHSLPNNTVQHISVNSNHPVLSNDHANLHVQSRDVITNRTAAYNSNNPNYSNVLLNIAARNQVSPNITPGVNSNMEQNRHVLISQSLYIQSGTGLPPKQAVPSVNMNQYVIRPPFSTSSNGGTVVVNTSQVGGQNVSALLTNVSNQQFYTSNQVSQLYYPPPPASQINCMQNSMPMPAVAVTPNQQDESTEQDQMFCAVCKNQATLRCKQCAKVAYCDTSCAKTYWHQKHKMECKPLVS